MEDLVGGLTQSPNLKIIFKIFWANILQEISNLKTFNILQETSSTAHSSGDKGPGSHLYKQSIQMKHVQAIILNKERLTHFQMITPFQCKLHYQMSFITLALALAYLHKYI